jgi:hypothetical protein
LAAGHRSEAFSSEVDTGSREENASEQKIELGFEPSEPRLQFDHRPDRDGWNGAADIL